MSTNTLAIIPARVGSKGVPLKNFRDLAGKAPWLRAYEVARNVLCDQAVLSSDGPCPYSNILPVPGLLYLHAPAPLHTDKCPMIDVIRDVLARVPGESDQIIVLLQPSSPLRRPEHVIAAIQLLEETGADSVVSVVEVPQHVNVVNQLRIVSDGLLPWISAHIELTPARRQDTLPSYVRDGTVYCFARSTITTYDNIYGLVVKPIIIPFKDSLSIDTELDWNEAERRLRELAM